MWKQWSSCGYAKPAASPPLPWGQGGKIVSQCGLKHIQSVFVHATDKLQSWVFPKLKEPRSLYLVWWNKPFCCESNLETDPFFYFGHWQVGQETMTVLCWGVNSSTWCCFPSHSWHPTPAAILLPSGSPHIPPSPRPSHRSTPVQHAHTHTHNHTHTFPFLSLMSNLSNPRPFTSDISKRLERDCKLALPSVLPE